jgi:hypothetical protein
MPLESRLQAGILLLAGILQVAKPSTSCWHAYKEPYSRGRPLCLLAPVPLL